MNHASDNTPESADATPASPHETASDALHGRADDNPYEQIPDGSRPDAAGSAHGGAEAPGELCGDESGGGGLRRDDPGDDLGGDDARVDGPGADVPRVGDLRVSEGLEGEASKDDGGTAREHSADFGAGKPETRGDVGNAGRGDGGNGDDSEGPRAGGTSRTGRPSPAGEASRGTDSAGAGAGAGADADDADDADDTEFMGTLTALFGGGDPAAPVGGMGGADASGAGSEGLDGNDLDEVALRRMLRGAVADLEPSAGTLAHLQRAVPARRARKRQAVVGVAAAVLLIGTAVPAFVHVANSGTSSSALPSLAGHGERSPAKDGGSATGAESGSDRVDSPATGKGTDGEDTPDPARSPSASGGADPDSSTTAGAADLDAASIAALPSCDPSQLGVDSAWTDTAAADGKVYGTFKIANTSGSQCSVSSAGTVGFSATGAADPLKINVVQHQSGDAATGLPDPAVEPGAVVLKPAMAYEVQFAWVPTDTCPTAGTSPTPAPTPTADNATGVGTGTGTSAEGVTAQQQSEVAPQFLARDDGGTSTSEGSITVTHTPEAGAPSAEATISNACAGTIYRTGILEAS